MPGTGWPRHDRARWEPWLRTRPACRVASWGRAAVVGSRAADRDPEAGASPAAARRTAAYPHGVGASHRRGYAGGSPGRGAGASGERPAQDTGEFLRAAFQQPRAQRPQGTAAAKAQRASRVRLALASGPGQSGQRVADRQAGVRDRPARDRAEAVRGLRAHQTCTTGRRSGCNGDAGCSGRSSG